MICGVVCDSQTTRHAVHTSQPEIIPQYYSFDKAQHTLPEDGPIGPKHVGTNKEIFQLYVLAFYVFNKRVHLLVKRILM